MREIGSVYAERTKRSLIIGCVSTLVSIPIMCCCLALLPTVVFPTLDNIAAGGNNQNTAMIAIIGIGLISLIGLISISLLAATVIIMRRSRTLDAIFTPLGLTGSSYMLYGRHYQGQIGEREVDVYIYRGPTVEIRLKTTVQTRVQIVTSSSLPASVAGLFNKKPLTTDNPVLEAYSIYQLDESWTHNLLSDAHAVEAIQVLMTLGADWAIFRRVEIHPGEVLLYLSHSRHAFFSSIELNVAQSWITALKSLAQAAESQPQPKFTAQPLSASSRQSRQKMNKWLVYSVVFILFVMPLCFIAIGVIAYLIVTLIG